MTATRRLAVNDEVSMQTQSERPSAPALPPERADETTRRDRWGWVHSIGSRYALVAVWAAMALTYYIVKPEAFGRASTFQSIFGGQEQQLYIFLALAALSTLIVGEFDLSVASVMGLAATIIPVLNAQHHVNIVLSCIVGVAAATACGAVNAFFIVGLGVPSLVVTLGSGTLFIGIAELLSGTGAISIRPSFGIRRSDAVRRPRHAGRVLVRPRVRRRLRLRLRVHPARAAPDVRRRQP